MTIIVWDGVTLASDSGLFAGSENQLIVSKTYKKIWRTEDFVWAVCGSASDYYAIEQQIKRKTWETIDAMMDLSISEDSEAIIFWKHTPTLYYSHDGNHLMYEEIDTKEAMGNPEEYATALLNYGLGSEEVVRQCVKNHTGALGKAQMLNIGRYFKW